MASELRHRASKARHDSDSALVKADQNSRTDSEVESLKDELADKVETWRHKVEVCVLDLQGSVPCANLAGQRRIDGFICLVDSYFLSGFCVSYPILQRCHIVN